MLDPPRLFAESISSYRERMIEQQAEDRLRVVVGFATSRSIREYLNASIRADIPALRAFDVDQGQELEDLLVF